jgi:hypothetical protein
LFDLINSHTAECAKFLEAVLEMETTPMTQNSHYLQATTEKWVARYKEQRAGKTPEVDGPSPKRRKAATTAPAATANCS